MVRKMITTKELIKQHNLNDIGIYIHIPFCRKKCEYCDFLSVPINDNIPEEYIDALTKELRDEFNRIKIKSIYFGGGTPSLLKISQIDKIISYVNKLFILDNPEITIEINPDDISETWAKNIQRLGINRVSIGIQSFNDGELQYLGRRHNAKKAMNACEIIAKHFNNWNLDLIFGIPFQSEKTWVENLKKAIQFNPKHISTYNLTFEEGTPLLKNKLKDRPDDDFCLYLYKLTIQYLNEKKYKHYEISNFAKNQYKCVHNLIYWKNEHYLGIGAGAFSFIRNIRCSNLSNIQEYIKLPGVKEEENYLTDKEIKVETLIQYFRLDEGISEKMYFARFSSELSADFGPALKKLIQRRLLEYNRGIYKPTPEGFYLNNEIGRELLTCIE